MVDSDVTREVVADHDALRMSPAVRKLALVAHVGSSVGWLGAVLAFLALSVAALSTSDSDVARSAYVAMNIIGQLAIVPLSILTLVTGIVEALGTHWGLLRYYWVLTKLALTVGATLLLLLHQFNAVAGAARVAASTAIGARPLVGGLGTQLVFDASLAAAVLLVTTVLSIYKPWGLIQAAPGRAGAPARQGKPLGVRIFIAVVGLIFAAIVALHLSGHGMSHHRM
jgi:hypothetical protein